MLSFDPSAQGSTESEGTTIWEEHSDEMNAWKRLEFLQDDKTLSEGYFSPGIAKDRGYTKRLKDVLNGRGESIKDEKNIRASSDAAIDLEGFAKHILSVGTFKERDMLPAMRKEMRRRDVEFRDSELRQVLEDAKASLIAATPPEWGRPGGSAWRSTEADWLWEGMIKPGLNMVFSAPKIGKSSLLANALSSWAGGATEYLGRQFYGVCPRVVLIGTDQGDSDWRAMFGTDTVPTWISKIITADDGFCLDKEGIAQIAADGKEHPRTIYILDSFSSLTAPLGLDENKADIANPLRELLTALEGTQSTGVVTHHSNKGGGTVTGRMRGSGAIAAVPRWYVELSTHQGREHRILVQGMGRARSRSMIIERTDAGWDLLSEGEGAAETNRIEQIVSALTDRQMIAYDYIERRSQVGFAVTASELAVELGVSKPAIAGLTIKQLVERGLISRGDDVPPGLQGGRPQHSFWHLHYAPARGVPKPPIETDKPPVPSPKTPTHTSFTSKSVNSVNHPLRGTPREGHGLTPDEPFPFVPPAPVELLQPDGSWQNGWIVHSDTSRWEVVVEKLGSPLVKRRGLRPSLDVRPCSSTPPESPSEAPEPPSRPWRPGDPGEPPF